MTQPITEKEKELLDIVFISILRKHVDEFYANDFYTDKQKELHKPFLAACEEMAKEIENCMYRNCEKVIKIEHERR